mmetsp:Transcript_15282/g.13727  ORF Transcript_15282/g.13727 Transcript_15282/m.13727 type:complete len:108 (+) Transcript_15282:38-361(+)|eukprot:CAMPEP_0201571982 /NCGR_PEP_ID=MMETSP0190_2-20130828/15014_1 /ASSEMBLY_ACC=CAM_ASM_000263 /TAXON_ID=37353 /ORGANISM="Rosalina sp." /LENGTH=107 /DNA_ID=CAMNT_0047997223 /DNA_START=33 /DNA_END=356 /DNA_ORIENTATION=-
MAEEKEIDYSKVSHQYEVGAELAENNVKLTLTVTDSITNKTWTYVKPKDDGDKKGQQLSALYDKVKEAIERGQGAGMEIGEFPANGQPLKLDLKTQPPMNLSLKQQY